MSFFPVETVQDLGLGKLHFAAVSGEPYNFHKLLSESLNVNERDNVRINLHRAEP